VFRPGKKSQNHQNPSIAAVVHHDLHGLPPAQKKGMGFVGFTRPGKRLQKTMERSTMLLMGKLTYFYDHFQ